MIFLCAYILFTAAVRLSDLQQIEQAQQNSTGTIILYTVDQKMFVCKVFCLLISQSMVSLC